MLKVLSIDTTGNEAELSAMSKIPPPVVADDDPYRFISCQDPRDPLLPERYQPRYNCQETWPGEGKQDFFGYDGNELWIAFRSTKQHQARKAVAL